VSRAIEVRDLFRVFSTPQGDAAALQGLSLSVEESEIVAVLGPSGAGKSTLLRILAGLDRPSAGTASVFGLELGKLESRGLARYRGDTLGYADQHYAAALAPELTAHELVALPLRLRGWSRRASGDRADELLERAGLLGQRARRPGELSGGEQQRVAVCAALAHRPRLLLTDEPTGELDADSARRVYDLIRELSQAERCTTVIVSHDPVSSAIADRTIRVRDGRVSEELGRGSEHDLIVVGRGGWLRLPEELLRRAGIGSRASAGLHDGAIVVSAPEGEKPELDEAQSPRASTRPPVRRIPTTPVVHVRGVFRRFGDGAEARTPIRNLSATFDGGALSVVTGPSGSGKTTLFHLLAGLDLPSEGEIVILDTVISRLDRRARASFRREHVALIGQQPVLIPFLSARENVELGLTLRGRTAREGGLVAPARSTLEPDDRKAAPARVLSRPRTLGVRSLPASFAGGRFRPTDRDRTSGGDHLALEALAAVGLAERSEQHVAVLSTGERVRVAIARALAARPAVLLADEPTARLDAATAVVVTALLSRLAAEWGVAVLCATHDPLVIEQADDELPLGREGPPD